MFMLAAELQKRRSYFDVTRPDCFPKCACYQDVSPAGDSRVRSTWRSLCKSSVWLQLIHPMLNQIPIRAVEPVQNGRFKFLTNCLQVSHSWRPR